jgi:hypothetical protein
LTTSSNAYVERYHRTFNQECLQVHRPGTLEQVCEVTRQFLIHYNEERPHQGRSCGNQPPRKAFPVLPTLSALPLRVDPDRWVDTLQGQAFARRIGTDGCVSVNHEPYYIKQALAGKSVVLCVNAHERAFDVYVGSTYLKRIPIKGVRGAEMPLEAYLTLMQEEARSRSAATPIHTPGTATIDPVDLSLGLAGKQPEARSGGRLLRATVVGSPGPARPVPRAWRYDDGGCSAWRRAASLSRPMARKSAV